MIVDLSLPLAPSRRSWPAEAHISPAQWQSHQVPHQSPPGAGGATRCRCRWRVSLGRLALCLAALSMAPFASPLGFEQVANFRLVAPTATLADGRRLVPGLLYRTAQLNAAAAADVQKLREIPIMTYIDLRDPQQEPPAGVAFSSYLALDGWPLPPGTPRRLSCSISDGVQPLPAIRDDLPELAADDPVKPFWDEWTQVEDDGTRRFVSVHGGEREATPELTTAFLLGYNACCMRRNSGEILKAMKAMTVAENFPLVFGCVTGKE